MPIMQNLEFNFDFARQKIKKWNYAAICCIFNRSIDSTFIAILQQKIASFLFLILISFLLFLEKMLRSHMKMHYDRNSTIVILSLCLVCEYKFENIFVNIVWKNHEKSFKACKHIWNIISYLHSILYFLGVEY